MKIISLARYSESALSELLAKVAKENLIFGIFNPSYRAHNDRQIIAFRGFFCGETTGVRAWLMSSGRLGEDVKLTDLTKYLANFDVAPVADPKLFQLGDALYITFNTGWSRTENKIYICQVAPALGKPIECLFDGRQDVEKNWAFYGSEEALFALYSLSNGLILKGCIDELRGVVEFKPFGRVCVDNSAKSLSIGTQFLDVCGLKCFIAHRKISVLGKRLYFGVPAIFDEESLRVNLPFAGFYLVHSFRSLLGSRRKLNKNLLSCTYFSGIDSAGGKLVVSYGVNDDGYGFASFDLGELREC